LTAPQLAQALAGLTPERRLVGRNLSKADVFVYRVEGRRIAVKDYAARPFLARHTVGRFLTARECRAYERAGAVTGLGRFLGRLGPWTMATAWIDAIPLSELPQGVASPALFDRLDALVGSLHAHGVAMSDLHHRDVLVAEDGGVHVVDLAMAYLLGPHPGWFRRRAFARLCAQDRLSAARMRARFTGQPEEEALASLDPAARRLWAAGRRIKGLWDRLRGRN
jgi:hypothetical protein